MRPIVRWCALLACVLLAAPGGCQVQPLLLSNCEDPGAWEGGVGEKEQVKEGSGAILWDHAQAQVLRLKTVPGDWSPYNTLSFWLYAPKATGSRFMLIIDSENEAVEGADYYQVPVVVDFTGWKQFSTGHFRFIFEDSARERAKSFAAIADDAWNAV